MIRFQCLSSKHPVKSRGQNPWSRLEADPAVIFVLDRQLRILYCNAAWDRFAQENGGHGLERENQVGRGVLDSIPEPLKDLYAAGYRGVLASQRVWAMSYECSSPAAFRRFHLSAYPDPRGTGVVVVNSLEVERPHEESERPAHAGGPEYIDAAGMVRMCCHCRRTRRVQLNPVWDWVPSYVEQPPSRVSHWICEACADIFFPDLRPG